MPPNEWRRTGAHAWRKIVKDHANRCAAAMADERLFHKLVSGFVSLAFVEFQDDQAFLKAIHQAEQALGDTPPTFGYRLMQFTACLQAFRRSGTLGREEIPFEASGDLEALAMDHMDGPDDAAQTPAQTPTDDT